MVALMGTVITQAMDLETARIYVQRINEHIDRADYHIDQARKLIWELKEQQGWKTLGYKSWAQCVKTELHKSSSTVYRQLSAALVELELSPTGGIGQINERVLRPLTKREYSTEARQAIWAIANDVVGEGGKVTEGVINAVVDGFKDMLQSGTVQDGDGNQHPITEVMKADLVARVRQVRLAHKDHIRSMDAKREYLVGRTEPIRHLETNKKTYSARVYLTDMLEMHIDKIAEAKRLGKPIYCSLWTE